MMPELRVVVAGWSVAISMHALCVPLAALAGALVSARRARDPLVVLAWAPVLTLAALAGSQALYRAAHGSAGGMSSMGGVAALALMVAAAARLSGRRVAELADAVAPGALVALAVGRLGCFLAGCCWGRPTDLPWGVVFPELGPPARHPVQLYAAAADALLALAAARPGGPAGAVAARAAAGLGGARLVLELLRDPAAADPPVAGLDSARAGAVCLLAAGLVARALVRRSPAAS